MDRREFFARSAAVVLVGGASAVSLFAPGRVAEKIKLTMDSDDLKNVFSGDKQKAKVVDYLMKEYEVPERKAAELLYDMVLSGIGVMGMAGGALGFITSSYRSMKNREKGIEPVNTKRRILGKLFDVAMGSVIGGGIAGAFTGHDPEDIADVYGLTLENAQRFCDDMDTGRLATSVSGIAFGGSVSVGANELADLVVRKATENTGKMGALDRDGVYNAEFCVVPEETQDSDPSP